MYKQESLKGKIVRNPKSKIKKAFQSLVYYKISHSLTADLSEKRRFHMDLWKATKPKISVPEKFSFLCKSIDFPLLIFFLFSFNFFFCTRNEYPIKIKNKNFQNFFFLPFCIIPKFFFSVSFALFIRQNKKKKTTSRWVESIQFAWKKKSVGVKFSPFGFSTYPLWGNLSKNWEKMLKKK